MNTPYTYKRVLSRHQSQRLTFRSRTATRQRKIQTIIGAGISVFILTLGFVVTLNVSEPEQSHAAIKANTTALEVNANISNGNFSVSYAVRENVTVEISLKDSEGKKIFTASQDATIGTNRFSAEDNRNFKPGTYFVCLKAGELEQIMKIEN